LHIDLSGRIAVVTGASRRVGIGAAVARRLAAAGADIFVTYFRPYDASMPWGSRDDEIEALLAELRALGVRAYGMEANLAQPTGAAHVMDAVSGLLGTPAILVNNACVSEPGDILHVNADQLDRHYAVNTRATVLLCQEFVRRWTGERGGRIISVSSGQSYSAMPGEIAYVVTKAAIEALTLTLAAEVAGRGITVNAIDPGATDTGWMDDDLRDHIAARTYLGRIGLPTDAANLICFLASEQGEWITGQIIRSRGGA